MSLADSSFPSSVAFDAISNALSDPTSRAAALKNGGKAVFAFTITNKNGETASWYIDLKESGTVGKGTAPEGKKADVTLLFKDDDFTKLVKGEVQAQRLFMGGRMKVKGDLMKATKVEIVMKQVRSAEAPKAKL